MKSPAEGLAIPDHVAVTALPMLTLEGDADRDGAVTVNAADVATLVKLLLA